MELRHDAVRLVYTVYFGERPGAGERRKMDRNRDGTIDDAESRELAAVLLRQATPFVVVELDGKASPAPWTVADVGLGVPSVTGGSFSVDLTMEAALPPGPEHSLWLEDRWPIPDPGETEVRVEAAPGVDVLASHPQRTGKGVMLNYRYVGVGGPEHGMLVRFKVDPSQVAPPPPAPKRRASRWLWWVLAGVGLGLCGMTIAVAIRRSSGR